MNPVHRDYLLKRFREERSALLEMFTRELEYAGNNTRANLTAIRYRDRIKCAMDEIEYQIERAFKDMVKEGGAP